MHNQAAFFQNPDEYMVVVIDGSGIPKMLYLEICILGGILSTLGKELHKTPKYSNSQAREVIEDFFVNDGYQ